MFKDRGVQFIGINVPWDSEENARQFVADRKVPYAVGHDEGGRISNLYGVDATPITFVLYRDGNVAAIARGSVELHQLTAVLQQLSNEK